MLLPTRGPVYASVSFDLVILDLENNTHVCNNILLQTCVDLATLATPPMTYYKHMLV
jgi:hypothetical protein